MRGTCLSFENRTYTLRKSLQTTSASPCRRYMLLTSSVLSTTSKYCFEQPVASFLVCYLIFIEYYHLMFIKQSTN